MNTSLTCSVVIPTYNRRDLLRHTLDSLVAQTLPRDRFEVIVVDDGSSDGTELVVREFEDRLDVQYHYQEDLGFRVAVARNVGISHAKGDITVLVDSGVLLHGEALAAHLDSHTSASGPVAVIGYVYCFNMNNEDGARMREVIDPSDATGTIDDLRATGRWPDVREAFYGRHGDDFGDLPAPWFMYWTCNVSMRTAQARAVGMFDEAFTCWGGEDIDLGYRLHADGARFVLNRDAAALHYPHHKDHDDELAAPAVSNYQYIADKYDTPITGLLRAVPTVDFMSVNERILELGLPRCADHAASRRPADASAVSVTTQ